MRKRSFWRVLLTRSLNLLETRFSNRIELSGKKSRTLVISFKERLNRPGFCGGGFAGDGGKSASRRTFTVGPFIVIVADCELLLGVLKTGGDGPWTQGKRCIDGSQFVLGWR